MSEIERESMEVDVLFVGAGPATLAGAYHLMKQVEAANATAEAEGWSASPVQTRAPVRIRVASPAAAVAGATSKPASRARPVRVRAF